MVKDTLRRRSGVHRLLSVNGRAPVLHAVLDLGNWDESSITAWRRYDCGSIARGNGLHFDVIII